jgi:multidrug efflux pump subunit AcrB
MALNVSAWSIRRPLPSIVVSIILLVLGWTSFSRLAITRLPYADIPVISVVVTQFGAAPAELETQVTKIIEDGVSGVEGKTHITSSITDGISITTISFRLETNTDRALNDVKDAVTRVRANLPRNVNEPLIQRIDVVGLPIVTYAAIAPGKTPEELSWFVDTVVIRSLQGIRGVAQVERIGGVEREILVSLDPDRLQAVGLTAVGVGQRLRGNNVDLAGGRAEFGGSDQAIRTLAGVRKLSDLASTMIGLPMGGEVRLADLGTVTDTIADRRTFARFNGEPVVAFGIVRAKGESDVVVAAAVQETIDELKKKYSDVDLKLIDTSVEFTWGNYEKAIETLFEGAALAVIVVWLFLGDIRATAIAAVSLPLSIFPAFWAMEKLGFSLNLVSFLAITLSTGILVDDAIVEIENIVRHMRMGKSPYQAALEAADEIGLAVIAISLTIVAIFAPASFMPGVAGQFFKQFGITVSVQVLFSLLAARFVTPMLAAYFLRSSPGTAEKAPGRLLKSYVSLLTWSVRHYVITVLAGLVLFAGSIWSIRLLPNGFLPAQDTARSVLAIELPPGSQLSETEKVTEEIVTRLRRRPEIKSVFVDGGRIPRTPNEVRRAGLIINYTERAGLLGRLLRLSDDASKSERSISQRELEASISSELNEIPDIHYWFADENGLRAISFVVRGEDVMTVANVASEFANQMKRIPLVTNVVSDPALDRPELRIRPRADMTVRLGVSTESLSETIRVATIGDVGPALAKFDAGDRLVPIRVQLEASARTDQEVIEQLLVPTARGAGVPLSSIADIQLYQGPNNINRYDRRRQALVSADLSEGAASGDAIRDIKSLLIYSSVKVGYPPDITIEESGDAETLNEMGHDFADVMRLGLLMVYAVLVILFGSFLQPITILFSLPLSIGGAIFALLLAGKQLTIPVWIGILMLMGIVTKNAIMLVDFAIGSIQHGMDSKKAIIDAGQKRARPIVMTTVAMVAGMIPSALALGAGGEFRSPMALAVIGGLLTSTALSLVFVPAVFSLNYNLAQFMLRLCGRFVTLGGEGSQPKPRIDDLMINPGQHVWKPGFKDQNR